MELESCRRIPEQTSGACSDLRSLPGEHGASVERSLLDLQTSLQEYVDQELRRSTVLAVAALETKTARLEAVFRREQREAMV